MKRTLLSIICVMVGLCAISAFAQDETPTPEAVEVEASDGLVLKGDIYRPEEVSDEGIPALLLMHQNQSTRSGYMRALPDLLAAGYIVLTVDLRAHGQTGGDRDWVAAQTDTQTWLAWLREQEGVNPNKIAIMGASIGSNLALVGCAADPQCVTAIALSPGLDYFGVKPMDAVENGLRDRSSLLIAGNRDSQSVDAVRDMFAQAKGRVGAEMFNSSTHGTGFFNAREYDAVMPIILAWLETEFASVIE